MGARPFDRLRDDRVGKAVTGCSGTYKNEETKLDRGKPHEGLEDVVIFCGWLSRLLRMGGALKLALGAVNQVQTSLNPPPD